MNMTSHHFGTWKEILSWYFKGIINELKQSKTDENEM